jgi:Holliday junction DNA helicase RuvA
VIARLTGTLVERAPEACVVDVGGVGYRVRIPLSTYEKLPAQGERVTLVTHHHVRENVMELYGFTGREELELFETLIAISGVGPRTALAIVAAGSPADIRRAVDAGDPKLFTRAPGVGPKTARRILTELRDRVLPVGDAAVGGEGDDALRALVSLGLSPTEARAAVDLARDQEGADATTEVVVRTALRSMR